MRRRKKSEDSGADMGGFELWQCCIMCFAVFGTIAFLVGYGSYRWYTKPPSNVKKTTTKISDTTRQAGDCTADENCKEDHTRCVSGECLCIEEYSRIDGKCVADSNILTDATETSPSATTTLIIVNPDINTDDDDSVSHRPTRKTRKPRHALATSSRRLPDGSVVPDDPIMYNTRILITSQVIQSSSMVGVVAPSNNYVAHSKTTLGHVLLLTSSTTRLKTTNTNYSNRSKQKDLLNNKKRRKTTRDFLDEVLNGRYDLKKKKMEKPNAKDYDINLEWGWLNAPEKPTSKRYVPAVGKPCTGDADCGNTEQMMCIYYRCECSLGFTQIDGQCRQSQ